jgi:hypothetical protein
VLRFFWVSVGLLFCGVLSAQTTEVFGRVYDARTQEPMSYVSVKFKNVVQGVITDDKGIYRIKTTEKVDTLIFNFLGYKKVFKKVRQGKYQEINVEMEEGGISLEEVTVKAKKRKREVDTAANYVYYRVVENKSKNKVENANTYHYHEYTKLLTSLLNPPKWFLNLRIIRPFKFLFENIDYTEDSSVFIPGLMKESLAEVYYQKRPKRYKRIVTADVITGVDNESLNSSTDYHMANINTYDDLFVIAGKSFMSPFAPGAIVIYRYYLTDTVREAERTYYKLHFVAKNKEDVALKGYAWIDSATWGIKTFKFRPNEKANVNYIADYSVKQDFVYIKNQWIMQSENLQAVGSINKKRNLFSLLVQKHYERRNIEIDEPLPDSFFATLDEVVYDDSAKTLARSRLDTGRFQPLTPQERNVYFFSDTLPTVRAYKQWFYAINVLTTAMFRVPDMKGPVDVGRFYQIVSRNNVEGWRFKLGMRTNRFFSDRLYFDGHVAYGTKDKEWKYHGTIRIFSPGLPRKWNVVQFMYKYDMALLGQDNLLLTFDNFMTIFRRNPLQRVMKQRIANVQWEKDWVNGFSTMMAFEHNTFYDIPNVFDFTRFDPNSRKRIHVPSYTTSDFWIDFRYAPKEQTYTAFGYRYFQRITRYPQLNVRITRGVKGFLNGQYNYLKINAMLYHRLSWAAGYTIYTIKTGYLFGRVPYPSAFVFGGSITGFYYDRTTYNMMREFEFIGDKYISFWLDHHFEGFFLNKIPGIKKLQLREFLTFKALLGDFSKRHQIVLDIPNEFRTIGWVPYVEAGFGFENIFKVIRIDFLWRVTYQNPTRGNYWKDFGSNWGIKFAIVPKF